MFIESERASCCVFFAAFAELRDTTDKMVSLRLACILALCAGLAILVPSSSASDTPWPYLQVYPEVDESDLRTPLYFALMLSFGGDYTTIGALPAVQIALDYINSEPSILPGYSLHYTLTDSLVLCI